MEDPHTTKKYLDQKVWVRALFSCLNLNSALGKWGRTDLTGFEPDFILFSRVGVRPAPSKTHDFKGFRPDFNRILPEL